MSERAEITIDLSNKPYQLIVSFGEENCLCNDERYRRGKIKIAFDGPYRKTGTTIKHFTEDFFVDNNQVEGSSTLNVWDDVYLIEGIASRLTATNETWEMEHVTGKQQPKSMARFILL